MDALQSLPIVADIAISFFLVVGSIFTFLGSLGIVKLPDFYARLHGPTKNTTLGLGGILTASAIFFSVNHAGFTLREFLITLFLFMTAPISAHLMAKAGLHMNREFIDHHSGDEEMCEPADQRSE